MPLDHRLSKYRPRWTPTILKEFYPSDEAYPTLWGGDIRLDNLSCRLGLYDRNANGRFDDIGEDMILLAPFGAEDVTLYPHANADYWKEDFVLRLKDTSWEVLRLDSAGRWMEIRRLKEPAPSADIQFMDQLPNLPLKTLAGDTTYLHDHLQGDKLLYIEVWSSWHQRSFESTPYLKATFHKYREKLNVLSLIYNEVEYERVHRNNRKHAVDWPQAIYSEAAGTALLHLGWVPYGVLFSPDGKMIKSGLTPHELEGFLEELL